MLEFDQKDYRAVCIFARRLGTGSGAVRLLDAQSGCTLTEECFKEREFRRVLFPLETGRAYGLEFEGVEIPQIYLTDCPGQLGQGVLFLDPTDAVPLSLPQVYASPIREQYHFGPFSNWVNDPNGLCYYGGVYHLFYQANPFSQKWGNIYWGHAVSTDLIHWVHQPHVLSPQPAIEAGTGRRGGAFSGCALTGEDGFQIFFTRHDGTKEDDSDAREWQVQAFCRDNLTIEGESDLITRKPQGASRDFRDPKVQVVGGSTYMVLGSCISGTPAILLYRQENERDWSYVGELLREKTPGIRTIECPDFFPLDGSFVAVAAWMCHRDDAGRKQMTRVYIGDFDGERLQVKTSQWFDFGSNFYAVQSFEAFGRRIAIGWISDFYGEHREMAGGACGSMSLPRELSLKNGRLYMRPVREWESLKGECLLSAGRETRVSLLQIEGNTYYVRILLNDGGDFRLVFMQDASDTLSLERKDGQTGLVSTRKALEGVRFPSGIQDVREVEAFIDRRVCEVFLNGGEAAGTKLFYKDTDNGSFEGFFSEGTLESLAVFRMGSIWKDAQFSSTNKEKEG